MELDQIDVIGPHPRQALLHRGSDVQPGELKLAVKVESEEVIPALITTLASGGAEIMRVNPREHTLEEVYFELQGDAGHPTKSPGQEQPK